METTVPDLLRNVYWLITIPYRLPIMDTDRVSPSLYANHNQVNQMSEWDNNRVDCWGPQRSSNSCVSVSIASIAITSWIMIKSLHCKHRFDSYHRLEHYRRIDHCVKTVASRFPFELMLGLHRSYASFKSKGLWLADTSWDGWLDIVHPTFSEQDRHYVGQG